MRLASFFVVVTLFAASAAAQTLLVLNKTENSLAFIDPAANKILARVPTGDGPHEITLSSDAKLAFIGNYGSREPGNSLCIIDVPGRRELRRLDLGALRRPHGLAFADGKLYFTAEINKLIGRYDPAANVIDWLMGTGQNSTHMVMVSRDTSRIFTANIASDSITVMERGANPLAWNETVIAVGKGPEGVDLSPDEKELWAAHSRDGGISVIDVAAKKVTHTFDIHTKRSNRLKFTSDGKRVLVSDLDEGEVVVIDAPARKEIKRIKLGHSPEGILIPPGGGRAFIAVSGDNKIAVLDLTTLEVKGHIDTGAGPDGMAWVR